MRLKWILGGALVASGLAVGMVACFNPTPADGAWTCTMDEGYVCPSGLTCDRNAGLCVTRVPADLSGGDSLPNFDGTPFKTPRTCEQRVQQGAFSGLVNLGTGVNTANDETSLTVDGTQIIYLSNGAPMTATLSSPKTAGAGSALTISATTAITNFFGGSFAKDGSYWFAGLAGGTYSLYKATGSGTSWSATPQGAPTATGCAFRDPVFTDGDPTGELYVAYPLGGCTNAPDTVAQGIAGRNIGGFYSAFPINGTYFGSPFVVQGGTTLLYASEGSNARLYYSTRAMSGTDAAWTAPQLLPMGAIGSGTRDVQAVVSADCSTLYLVSQRPGGSGGLDLWAADIAPQ
jgi:hypothetical protein